MKTFDNLQRRGFIKNATLLGVTAGFGFASRPAFQNEEAEVTPAEDLMREHGLLGRILLIYDTCHMHLVKNEDFDVTILSNSAKIIRSFVEDYHEKLEENFLFPRFSKAKTLTDLVSVLQSQHTAGRKLTDPILKLEKNLSTDKKSEVIRVLEAFIRMYRPHKSREDTVLFPAIRKIVSPEEYRDLGEQFEDKEHELFGEKGFESMVTKVENLEKQLNIFELSKFTPVN
jgi:hemerythrin-like domain-containing protein